MLGLHLFIPGIAKCGTTSLAHWLVTNGLAEYRVPGVKEPGSYALGPVPGSDLPPHGVLLDATVGYAFNWQAIARMPAHNTKVVLCLRNSFDRCFSAYKYYQAIARRDETSVAMAKTVTKDFAPETYFEETFQDTKSYFPKESEKFVRKYFEKEADNVLRQSFKERVHYEIGFFLRRLELPFFTVIRHSFSTPALRNFLAKYPSSDIHLLTVDQLDSEGVRTEFIQDLLGSRADGVKLPPIPRMNSTTEIGFGEDKPDFHATEWDFLREYFRQDLSDFRAIADAKGVSMKYVNQYDLDKYLA